MTKAGDYRIKVEKEMRKDKDVATLVGMLRKVQALAADPDSSAAELAKVISLDPALTAKILHLVNSAHFGMERRISNVYEAVVILGYNQLKDICTGMMASKAIIPESGTGELDYVALWKHSLGTAVAAQFLQKYFELDEDADLYTAGLLANIGMVVLERRFHEEYAQVHEFVRGGKRLLDAEREVFGVTHAEVGWWIAEVWQMDETVAHTIKHHHGPAESKAADVVNLAYVLTQACRVGSPGEQVLAHILPGLFKRLDVDDMVLDQILRKLTAIYASLKPIFETVEASI